MSELVETVIPTARHFASQFRARFSAEPYAIRLGREEWSALRAALKGCGLKIVENGDLAGLRFDGLWVRRSDLLNELVVMGDNSRGPAMAFGYGELH